MDFTAYRCFARHFKGYNNNIVLALFASNITHEIRFTLYISLKKGSQFFKNKFLFLEYWEGKTTCMLISRKVGHERHIICTDSNMDMLVSNEIGVEDCTRQRDRLTNNIEVI